MKDKTKDIIAMIVFCSILLVGMIGMMIRADQMNEKYAKKELSTAVEMYE